MFAVTPTGHPDSVTPQVSSGVAKLRHLAAIKMMGAASAPLSNTTPAMSSEKAESALKPDGFVEIIPDYLMKLPEHFVIETKGILASKH